MMMMREVGENEVVVVEEIEEEEEEEMKTKGGVMRWESILHRMSIRVMLVEADDSTRQIIAALLRKCGYRVAAIPDGLKAWETLKGRPNNIDLILTEVELPSVSGFDLLTMISEHEICKNIPVIMMSSYDTMSMIFDCMLRGAADFLVKPVRTNELRNLWQHVWRRQSSPVNSHGPHDGSFAQQRIEAPSENKASSNHSSSYVATEQKNKECSEKESDTHSTCTKPNVEAESASVHNTQDFFMSSTALLSDTKLQKHGESVKLDEKKLVHERQEDKTTKFEEHKGGACNEDICSVEPVEEHDSAKTGIQGNYVPKDCYREDAHVCGETEDNNSERVEASTEAIDLIGTFDNIPHVYRTVVQKDFSNIAKSHLDPNDASKKLNSNLLLELSLRRSHPSDHGNQHSDVRNTWNHSNASAFSRYTNKSAQPLITHAEPTECVDESPKHVANQGPVSPPDASESNGATLKKDQQNVLPVICVPGRAQAAKPCPHLGVIPLPVPVRSIVIDSSQSGYGAVLSPMFYKQSGWPQSVSPNSVSQQGSTFEVNTSRQCDPEEQNADQCRLPYEQNATTSTEHSAQLHLNLETGENLVRISPGTGQSGISSVHDGAASHHFNSNGCGSISNGRIENVTPTGVGRRTLLENGRSEGLLICDGTRGINTCRSSQREAALNKFRLKRKDRCFEKKVRYESRQKLAEQRPRVKGQFVRQVPTNPPL